MYSLEYFKSKLQNLENVSFEETAIELFEYQYQNNLTYSKYVDSLGINFNQIASVKEIPFLPIELFKLHDIKSGDWNIEKRFLSSGTTSSYRSQHLIEDEDFYHLLSRRTFEGIYGNLEDITLMALLPSYQQQGNSGLISMVDHFISRSESEYSGYYLSDYERLLEALENAYVQSKNVILWGVSYALLEFSEYVNGQFPGLTIMETGGMKGRGPELVKEEFYQLLNRRFGTNKIHSEYGMTELMSQAYSEQMDGFFSPNWMKILIRDINDPFEIRDTGQSGGINVIDLANIHSCAFIETKDIGRMNDSGKFAVLGRIDNSDLRGCNLLLN